MLGELAVGYLFLGGAGAGAIALCSLVDLAWVRASFGTSARVSVDEAPPTERALAFGLLAGFAALVLGILCLLFDLGRIDRVLALFTSPSATFLTVGAFALAALAACGAFLAAVRFAYLPDIPRAAVAAVEVLATVAGLAVMLYTGLLLQDVGGVAFWRTPFVPALFTLSSLSCGAALLLIAAFFGEADTSLARLVSALARFDLAIIALEALAAAALVGFALAGDHPAAAASAERLATGDLALRWWVGFGLCGLVAPLAVEAVAALRRTTAPALRAALAVAAVLVLMGGFSMRSAIVDAGMHRDLALEEPSAQALRLE
ncbi:NrfD/PsrC family molybdoenzyme membrane anchor subunit [Arabiibacter massiliensis]|uniref:NrfD/PsrC family molybdoenzyme membrane anchor subunit n=1 Tax=Arabiibacter massiliensis TaxID=1870985 RepID=UPI0009B956E9|nr:NrfD/PsrC family molybdoenzyme membrane anchor subunit [Arabiibacter massiliensis]